MNSIALPCALVLVCLFGAAPAAAQTGPGYHLVWDDFHEGWSVDTPTARWLTFTDGSYVASDGLVTTGWAGLEVVPRGVNAVTGEPAFSLTLGQAAGALAPFDHAKWIVVMNHFSSRGFVGFDAVAGQELVCEADVSGQVLGGRGQPFGDAVTDPEGDIRLGNAAISAFDPETFVIFNFIVTNTALYAWYERPVFLRGTLGDYASFAFAVPVMPRTRYDQHRLGIAYDRARGTARWLVDGQEVYRVDTIGARIDREFLLIDHGGDDVSVPLAQLDCGMALFDFLDGYGPTQRGLVQIDGSDDYFNPRLGAPVGVPFVDPESTLDDRLFGQGATMQVGRFVVESRPTDGGEVCE
jgi:hypothetical protein